MQYKETFGSCCTRLPAITFLLIVLLFPVQMVWITVGVFMSENGHHIGLDFCCQFQRHTDLIPHGYLRLPFTSLIAEALIFAMLNDFQGIFSGRKIRQLNGQFPFGDLLCGNQVP